jgi:putative thioredoxin
VPPTKLNDPEVLRVKAELDLSAKPTNPSAIAELAAAVERDPSDHQSRHDLAIALNGADRREEALEHLLTIVASKRDWNDEAARKQLVQFFDAWGPKDPLTLTGRRRLSSILFS